MLDQLSAKWLEQPGVIDTPNINRLRRMGVTFNRAYSSNPVCMPARATLATGLTCRQHGVLQNGYVLDPEIPGMASMLQAAGWRTGAFGKLHHVPHSTDLDPDYHPYGYDVVHSTSDSRTGEWLDWIEREHPQHYEAALATIWAGPWTSGYESYGKERIDLMERIIAAMRKFPQVCSQEGDSPSTRMRYTLPFPKELSQTEWITRHGCDFIRQTTPDQPFYAFISYVQPHNPFSPPAEYLERVNVEAIPEPLPPTWQEDPDTPEIYASYSRIAAKQKNFENYRENWREIRQYYFADLIHLDEQLGEVFKALEEKGRLESTTILLLADHGELLLDHALTDKGEPHYDACTRIPLIVAGPGFKKGVERDELVQLEDICPTLLEIAEVKPPQRAAHPALRTFERESAVLPGRSLVPLCRGDEPDWREAAYIESYNLFPRTTSPKQWARTLVTQRYRYTLHPCRSGEQLFDLKHDPGELKNLVRDPAHQEIRQEMRDLLLENVILQDYPLPPRDLQGYGIH